MNRAGVNKELTLGELREIVAPIATQYGVPRVYLFGSRARGDNKGDSDFDFCIDVPVTFDLFKIGAFLYDLREILGAKVDVVCEDDIFDVSEIREEILRDRRIIFDA